MRSHFCDKSRNPRTCGNSKVLTGKKEWLQCKRPIIFIEDEQVPVIKTAFHRLLDQVVVLKILPGVRKTAFPKFHWHIASVLEDERVAARQGKLRFESTRLA